MHSCVVIDPILIQYRRFSFWNIAEFVFKHILFITGPEKQKMKATRSMDLDDQVTVIPSKFPLPEGLLQLFNRYKSIEH